MTTERLHALIEAEPGITKSEIRRSTGLAWGTICRHTERLVSEGRVVIHGDGKHQHLVPAHVSESVTRRQVALRRPHARDVLRLFDFHREVDIPRAMEETGLSRRIIALRLTELEEAGLLERRGFGRPRFARPAAALHPRRAEGGLLLVA